MKKVLALIFGLVCMASVNAEGLYIIGDATPANWELGRLGKTTMTEVSSGVYEWTGILYKTNSEGFKILTQNNDWNPGIHPSENGKAIDTAGSDVVALPYSGSPDSKWTVSTTAEYKIRVTLRTEDVLVECTKVRDVVVGGVLQIATADELENFAYKLDNGWIDGNINVALTADIDLSSYNPWLTIGTDAHKYVGTFDGQGYRIKNMTSNGSYQEQGFFGVIGAGAYIKNLIMDASCTVTSTEGKCFAAFAGCCNNNGTITFENCGNEANVTGTQQNNAGFLGCNYGATQLVFTNCYNKGNISGGRENGAFCGWTGGGATFNNCYNIGNVENGETWARGSKNINNCYETVGSDGGVTKVTNEQVASGELCYKLNGDQNTIGWYQTIGTDGYPVPFSTGHSQVYANGTLKCDGTSAGGDISYSNSSTSVIPPHTFTGGHGWCTVCGTLDQNYLTANSDGFYLIGNANDLRWFADLVKGNQNVKAKLTDNIDYTEYKQGFIGISQSVPFRGVFDGQEYTVKIDIVNTDLARTGLFAFINAATIKNLVVEGSATSAGNNCVGGLGGRSDGDGTLIENVIVKTAVSYTGSNSDATCGGFFANMEGSVTLKNCAFLGSINSGSSVGNGGLVGWAGGGSNNKYINCLVAPVEYTQNGNSADFARNNPSVTNSHKVAPTDPRLASGELCYTLNAGGDNWYQNLGTDATPVPFSSHSKVYANASYNCDGTPKGDVAYANVNEEQHDPHQAVDGFCTVCNAMVSYIADYMTPAADGYYEISNNKQMRWFAATVNDVNASVNGRLVADIDFTGITDYAPIGKESQRFVGTFDGQNHQITNLALDLEQDEVGVFGVISEGSVIKNLILASSSSITGNSRVGFVGMVKRTNGGEIHLECLGNEANIKGRGKNVGGILGVNMNSGGYAKLYMTNCYTTGAIEGSNENGQLTGWSGDNAVAENCYAIGTVTNCDGFGRFGGNCTITNCYCDKELTWDGHPTLTTTEQLASGELCYKLGEAFSQLIGTDTHPAFGNAPVSYIGEAGYATLYDTSTGYELNGDVKAFVAVLNTSWLDLTEIENIPEGTPVILKGTYYNKLEADLPAINIANELLGTAEDTEADGTMYILAQVDGKVGFYKATGTIPAGKAYYKNATLAREAFFFDGDDATGISVPSVSSESSEAIYNLAGQRLNKMQKGINIINGKKVLF